jgi:hypothetical protein
MRALMFVLRKDIDVPKSGVQHIRECEVDDTEHAAERHGWFWLIRSKRIEAFALASAR